MTPELLVVVDTEEEFDWKRPLSREAVGTRSIPAQERAHQIFDRYGIVPTYVIDYPVATDPESVSFLRSLKAQGKAEIGAHLHGWVTPPFEEEVNPRNSYQCNLPYELERAKIERLTLAIEGAFGERPTIFKAGRHGFGPNTARILAELGYRIDCSQLPATDLRHDGGPDFRKVRPDPYWLDYPGGLLEVPLTIGFFGAAARAGPAVSWIFDSPAAGRLHIPGFLARSGIVSRSRLTPEGVPPREQCRLVAELARRGHATFSLAYHSPSLEPGHTPYVRTQQDLEAFLQSLERVFGFFRDRLGGRFTTLSQLRGRLEAQRDVA